MLCINIVSVFVLGIVFFFFFKQKTAYEMRISDWSSDVCSSDLRAGRPARWQSRIDAARSKALGRLDVQKTVFARLVRKIELRRCRAFAEIALGAAEAAEERAVIDLHHAAVRLRQPDAGGRCEVGQDIVARFAERRISIGRAPV